VPKILRLIASPVGVPAKGGLAGTPTGEAIKRKIFGTAEDMVKNN
jgi:L-serine dehydratase